ncbi:uncharacterized protein LOC131052811 [Cryptomeria japonica]|uniref:uncharacterized protein LOC131052811 n=1 Tax=Cryptomeria japonica TaxID=3369 RepID=UPI0027DAA643|nr:uncharacterized protein LOC131052811 [Cryptomeria japonica]
MTKKRKLFYYAVRKGYNPGVYQSWKECKNQISGFPNNEYKGFSNLVEAEEYLKSPGGWSFGRGWSADANLLEKNSDQQFSEFDFTAERTSLRKSTCGNGLLVNNSSLKDLKVSQSSEVKAEDCFDYLPLELMCREPSNQQTHDARFSSFSEMCNLLCDSLACGVNLSEIKKPAFLLHERVRSLKRHVSLIDDDDDDDGQLLDFASESHLYNYLGLEKDKGATTSMGERYFNISVFILEILEANQTNELNC